MSEERSWSEDTKKIGDSIVALTLTQAKELSDYLEEEHGIKAAAGGAVVMAGPAAGGEAEAEQSYYIHRRDPGTQFLVVCSGIRVVFVPLCQQIKLGSLSAQRDSGRRTHIGNRFARRP